MHIKSIESNDIVSSSSSFVSAISATRIFSKRRTLLIRSTTTDEFHDLSFKILENENSIVTWVNNSFVLLIKIFSIDIVDSFAFREKKLECVSFASTQSIERSQLTQRTTSFAKSEKVKQIKTSTYAMKIVLQLWRSWFRVKVLFRSNIEINFHTRSNQWTSSRRKSRHRWVTSMISTRWLKIC